MKRDYHWRLFFALGTLINFINLLYSIVRGSSPWVILPLALFAFGFGIWLLASEIDKNAPDLKPAIFILRKFILSVLYRRTNRITTIHTSKNADVLHRILLTALKSSMDDLSSVSNLSVFRRWSDSNRMAFRMMEDTTDYRMTFGLHQLKITNPRGFSSIFPLHGDTYKYLTEHGLTHNDIRDPDMVPLKLMIGLDGWMVCDTVNYDIDVCLLILDFHVTYMDKINRQKHVYLWVDAFEMIRLLLDADSRISKIATIAATDRGVSFVENLGFQRAQLYKTQRQKDKEESWFFYTLSRLKFLELANGAEKEISVTVQNLVSLSHSHSIGDHDSLTIFRKFYTDLARAARAQSS